MNIDETVRRFKFDVSRKLPFYGDIVINMQFVSSSEIKTAMTNGYIIYYNPKFFESLSTGEINFVLMHEVFHILLKHPFRSGNRDPIYYNIACDMVVNNMVTNLLSTFKSVNIPLSIPQDGIFSPVNSSDTVENLYNKIVELNINNNKTKEDSYLVPKFGICSSDSSTTVQATPDMILLNETDDNKEDIQIRELRINELIREAHKKVRGQSMSVPIPVEILELVTSRKLNWKALLKDFFVEEISDDTSYSTPERKYIHMDMILPGHCISENKLFDVWAFIDSSGSISSNEINEFITQLYRIMKEFHCTFNICYWNTSVTDVYKGITKEKDIIKCTPKHSGGTNINCVYNWIEQNNVNPDIMLILTDGYFGKLITDAFKAKYSKKTILVLSGKININDDMKKIGKIARL